MKRKGPFPIRQIINMKQNNTYNKLNKTKQIIDRHNGSNLGIVSNENSAREKDMAPNYLTLQPIKSLFKGSIYI